MKKTIFDILSFGFLIWFVYLLFSSKGEILFIIGGSLWFVSFIGVFYYVSLIKKQYSVPLRIISLICWCLIFLSYLAYKESDVGLTREIIIASVSFFVLLNIFVCILIFKFIKKPDISLPEYMELWKKGTTLLLFRFLIPITIYMIGTVIVMWPLKRTMLVLNHRVNFLSVALLLMIVFYGFSAMRLKKNGRAAYSFFFIGEQGVNELITELTAAEKKIYIALLIVFFLANLTEFIRGMWVLNLLTLILFVFILLYLREFITNLAKRPSGNIEENFNSDLPVLKGILFHSIGGVLYIIFLTYLSVH